MPQPSLDPTPSGLDCADNDDDRATIAALRKAILQELNLHASVLKLGFSSSQLAGSMTIVAVLHSSLNILDYNSSSSSRNTVYSSRPAATKLEAELVAEKRANAFVRTYLLLFLVLDDNFM